MILRKPYAFLIKYFRSIHFLLSFLIGYVMLRTSKLLYFFNTYIKRNIHTNLSDLTERYTDFALFFAIAVIIILMLIIFLLMNFKKKPRLFYLIAIFLYTVSLFIFGRAYFNLEAMKMAVLDPRVVRITRDAILILSLSQYFIMLNTLFTAIGFNIKKFNFQEDLEELDIATSDSEEFEFVLGFNLAAIITKLKNQFRNARYVFIENRYIILLTGIIIGFLTTAFLFINTQLLNKVYKEGQLLKTSRYELKVLSSYLDSKDTFGVEIDDYYYVIVKFNLKNLTTTAHELATSTLVLMLDGNSFYPVTNKHQFFTDLGNTHHQKVMLPNESYTFIAIYQIDKLQSIKKVTLKLATNYAANKIDYKNIKLQLKRLDEKPVLVKSVSPDEVLSFDQSILANTSLKITSFTIKDEFQYEYELCISDTCHLMQDLILANTMTKEDRTILKLDLDFSLAPNLNTVILHNAYDLIHYFGAIKYYKEGKWFDHKLKITNLTPLNYNDDSIFIDVIKDMQDATKIEITFNIRNKQYIYLIDKERQ